MADSEAAYRVSLALFTKLADDFPDWPEHRDNLADIQDALGDLLRDTSRAADAEVAYRVALALRTKLADDFPAKPNYRADLGGSYYQVGELLRVTGKPADSLDWFAKAIATLAPVHVADPAEARATHFLCNSHWCRAQALDQLGRDAEAVADWDRAVELSRPADRHGVRAYRAISLLQAGQVERAVAEAAMLTALPEKWDDGQWYNFACIYAVASGKLADKREVYASQAVKLLQKAVAAGYRDRAHMEKDTVLDPLRSRADFRAVLAALPEQAPPPRPAKGTP